MRRSIELDTLRKLQKRVGDWFRIRGFPDTADDAAQEYALAILEGRSQHQTVNQFCVNYLRKFRGDPRTRSFTARVAQFNACDDGSLDRIADDRPRHDGTLDNRVAIIRAVERHGSERDQRCVRHALNGFTYLEIAQSEAITEARVSQLFKNLGEKIQAEQKTKGEGNMQIGDEVNVKEAHAIADVCAASMAIWVREGKIPSRKEGNRRFIKVEHLKLVKELREKHGSHKWHAFAPWPRNQIQILDKNARPKPTILSGKKERVSLEMDALAFVRELVFRGHDDLAIQALKLLGNQL